MADDIICTVPEYWGDSDTFHLKHYWIYTDGKRVRYSHCDSDGNHTDCYARDVPSFAQQDRAWLDYHRHVLHTGEDPLREYTVKTHDDRRERWTLEYTRTILGTGIAFFRARRGGAAWIPAAQVPEYVRRYAGVRKMCSNNLIGLVDFAPGDVQLHDGKATRIIVNKVPRDARVVGDERKKIARRAIADILARHPRWK